MKNMFLLLAVLAVVGCSCKDERGVIHVAPNGDDAAAGTRSAPLRTLAGAQARVRSLKAAPGGLPAGGLTVLFAPGTYRMSEAVRFDERDSGSAACPIVYRAEARTTAKMSGSVALDWRPPAADDPNLALVREPYRSRVVTATVPGEGELPGFECGRTQQNPFGYALFREGVRLPLSRWPNGRDALIPAEVVNLDNTGVKKLPAYAFGTDAPRLADWTKEPDPWAWGCWKFGWDDSSMPIQKVDPAAKTLTIGSRYIHYGIAKGSDDGGWYRVLNCLSELDEPGEWVADRKARRLYLLPPAEGAADVVASAADRLVVCTNLAHVAFEGFTFEECRGDAIRMDECTNVAVQASVVRSTGGWAVTILGGRDCRVEGCDLYELGEGVTPVERRHDYPAPMVSVRAEFDGAPAACGDYVTNCVRCVVSRRWFPKGNILSAAFGAPMLRSGWQEYSFSFTPLQDETFTLSLEGWRGEKTVYDDVRVTGVTLQNGDFEGACGWDDVKVNPEMAQYGMITPPYGIQEAAKLEGVTAVKGRNVAVANAYLTVRQRGLKAKQSVPVTVTFKARPYVPGL